MTGRKLPPVTQVGMLSLALIVAGGIYLAAHIPQHVPLAPAVALLAASALLLAGNLIAETVWNYPGLGLLFYNSLGNADYNVLLAYTLIGAILTVAGNYIADIALGVADPRIRLS